jgi:hypothetical protein
MDTKDIRVGAIFANAQGRTIKIDEVSQIDIGRIYYYVDGGSARESDILTNVKKMLESGGYKDITQALSSFYLGTDPHGAGAKTFCQGPEGYVAEIIKKDKTGIHVRFSDPSNSKNSSVYIYDSKDFNFKEIFTPELITELTLKFTNSVFEVIGEDSKGYDVKVTVLGKSINIDLINKIKKTYSDLNIYQIKRLTNLTIQ